MKATTEYVKGAIVKRVPKWIVDTTVKYMNRHSMSLYDAFKEAVRDYPHLKKGSDLWNAFYYDDYREYIPSAYVPGYLNMEKYPLSYIPQESMLYTIRSESEDGVCYLVNGWNKHHEFWMRESRMEPSKLFKRPQDAKRSLSQLLKAMPEYNLDHFTLVAYSTTAAGTLVNHAI